MALWRRTVDPPAAPQLLHAQTPPYFASAPNSIQLANTKDTDSYPC